MDYFHGKGVLLTGGNSGIGLAIARRLRKAGANLIIAARDKDKLAAAKKELDELLPLQGNADAQKPVQTVSIDVREREATAATIKGLLAEQPIDVLISNAGVVMPGNFLELANEQFDDMMDTNFLGAVNLVRQVLPAMQERGSGHIAFVSSYAGLIGIYGYTAYSASKFAIRGFAQSLRCELKPDGIRVSVVYPPDTDTPQLEFEDQHKPDETRAIAGNVKALSADYVAGALLVGMAKGKFKIIPSFSARVQEWAYRISQGIAHYVIDGDVKKARAKR